MVNQDTKLIRKWRAIIGILAAVIAPTAAVCGAFYSLKLDAQEHQAKMNERVSALELSSQKEFADKDDLKEIRDDVKQLRTEVSDIKTILIRQQR